MSPTDQVRPGRRSWVEPSQARLVVAGAPREARAEISRRVGEKGDASRLVWIEYAKLPPIEPLFEKLLHDLASLALALWPDWYQGALDFPAITRSEFAFEARLAEVLAGAPALRRPVSTTWGRDVLDLCRAGRPPLLPDARRGFQAAQLALAIAPNDLVVALVAADLEPPRGHLLGLARAAEWLGRTTGAGVLVVVPEPLAGSEELDGISFDPLILSTPPAPPEPPEAAARTVDVWPILGRPHPHSPGEQLLARRLALDAMLGGLFHFNVRVETTLGSRFLVDLLWPEGRLVVEVDGYEHHSHRLAFSADRRRDYELLISGYLVLRLPHDEVIDDVEVALEKIRDLVRFRSSEGVPRP